MSENMTPSTGIRRLIRKYKEEFNLPENIRHYSEKDFVEAQKRYVSFRLKIGDLEGIGG